MTRRSYRKIGRVGIDVTGLFVALFAGFVVRFDGLPPTDMLGRFLLTAPYVVALEYAVLWKFGVPNFSWRYIGLREVTRIAAALAVASVLLVASRLMMGALQDRYVYFRHGLLPFGVLFANFGLAFLWFSATRILRRRLEERAEEAGAPKSERRIPTLLVGAGRAGLMMAQELESRRDLGFEIIGFLDDDTDKHGVTIHGVRVLGSIDRLPAICAEYSAEQVVISIASASGDLVRRIRALAESAGIPAKIIPGLFELVSGQADLTSIRDVAIEDLLRRTAVETDTEAIAAQVAGKTVFVTGAGGSIGSELCRQVMRFGPARLVLIEQAENALFQIHRELRGAFADADIVPAIADVTDAGRIRELFERHQPAFVLHAAAHKHVPMMEWNPGEAVKNNVLGTKVVAELASEFGVDTFVMISTDKAVRPTSVMGASKRLAELFVQSLDGESATRFVTVRFGNVLGSAGSVIPIFKEQIARGGPVTVTHADMVRFFMTIPEACRLVLQAATLGAGGSIFVLDMGEPVKILDLATDLIRLSGLRPNADVEIVFTGVRPGEKLYEELEADGEDLRATEHPKIRASRGVPVPLARVSQAVVRLEAIAREDLEGHQVRAAMGALLPDATLGTWAADRESSSPAPKLDELTAGVAPLLPAR